MKVFVVLINVDERTYLERVFDSFEKAEQFIFWRERFVPSQRERFYRDDKYGVLAEIREMEVE